MENIWTGTRPCRKRADVFVQKAARNTYTYTHRHTHTHTKRVILLRKNYLTLRNLPSPSPSEGVVIINSACSIENRVNSKEEFTSKSNNSDAQHGTQHRRKQQTQPNRRLAAYGNEHQQI